MAFLKILVQPTIKDFIENECWLRLLDFKKKIVILILRFLTLKNLSSGFI